ncbi:MAG: preprotein translocase subunit SecA [Alphaproteobacteria bacterium]|nr:preprotein translocase subunit SecA [Alphaproteobacteria bacterium]
MFRYLGKKLFGTVNDRVVQSFGPRIQAINALEPKIQALSDDELRAQTQIFRDRLTKGEKVDDILVEAFAVVREASRRALGMRHFDVQLMGGMVLMQNSIAEMKTGEGKTLVATLPSYLRALEGKGVHVVTVNDYLAKRDSDWMGGVHRFLGLSVGCIVHNMSDLERRRAYQSDITYGTNNEFGFDYLRDNMKYEINAMVQRGFHFALVDEVDSILVDEARTPLIISGPAETSSDLYVVMDKLIKQLQPSYYDLDEKARTVTYTEEGTEYVESLMKQHGLLPEKSSMYDLEHVSLVHYANQALRANKLFSRDVDYVVKDSKVIIIDEFTGRMAEGRRFSEGLHQALEAKEAVTIQQENQTLASITYQNYFRLYPHLGGMTGTAMTEANEFKDIYNLNVVEVTTNQKVIRKDNDDVVYRTLKEKYQAVIDRIAECHQRQQPVLVGTISIEKSEELSEILKKQNLPHHVLNARHHEKEAHIIAQAGRPGAITIATNMAGRGTDIMLGGNPELMVDDATVSLEEGSAEFELAKKKALETLETDKRTVINAGGLYVIGTERHESRRIDNQLRGRSGRQGDPGETCFFLSLEDDLLRIFGSDRISGLLQRMGLKDGEAIISPLLTRTLEKAQQKIEIRNYEIRKNLLNFDRVMNDQRKVIYEQRIELMTAENIRDTILDMIAEFNHDLLLMFVPHNSYVDEWDLENLQKEMYRVYGIHVDVSAWAQEEGVGPEQLLERIQDLALGIIAHKEELYGSDVMRDVEKHILLLSVDQLWKDHLHSLDHLRQGINLRAYGQKDPLNEYKREAFVLFQNLLIHLRETVIQRLSHVVLQNPDTEIPFPVTQQEMHESHEDPAFSATEEHEERVSRNDPCPCGSGKKYKHCHGKIE